MPTLFIRAGWVSLFTLHVIWPFLWIWATLYQPERGWGMQSHVASQEKATDPKSPHFLTEFRLEHQLAAEKKTDYSTFRRSNYGSIDCFNLRGAGVDGL